MSTIKRISLIGAGRVAHHLGTELHKHGAEIISVYGRDPEESKELAQKLGTNQSLSLDTKINADLILIAVSDDAVAEVAHRLPEGTDALVVHTSGAVPMTDLPDHLRRGVFYPLQSFSFDKQVRWENVPFCIEAENDEDVNALGELAERISRKVHLLSSKQRKALHLAAVFANNFSNLMFEYAEEILEKAEIDRSILHPLIVETSNKVLMQPAAKAQTGPAKRGDTDTIKAHRMLMEEGSSLREVYDLLTAEIYKRSDHDDEL